MKQQALDLRGFLHILWRRRILVGVIVLLGVGAGVGYTMLNPPMLTSTALVVLPQNAQSAQVAANGGPDPYTATQEVVASSSAVLSGALRDARPAMSVAELRRLVQVGSLTSYVISISAKSTVAADAEATANAVANSYIRYLDSSSSPVGRVPAQLLQPATSAVGLTRVEVLIVDGVIGAISGAVIAAIVALALSRADRRLRERDEVANAIGVPVIASLPVAHPSDAAGWSRLLDSYRPGALHALQLRKVLHHLGAGGDPDAGDFGSSRSVTIVSLATDRSALALGPQLATFAAAQGIATALVIGPQQDPDATATLRIAAAAPSSASAERPSQLQVTVADEAGIAPADAALTVVVAVVDGRSPQMPDTVHTSATLLGVSSGATTAELLARVAVCADAAYRRITGILLADPDPTDHTTGRIPQLSWPAHRRLPTRLKGISTEIRR